MSATPEAPPSIEDQPTSEPPPNPSKEAAPQPSDAPRSVTAKETASAFLQDWPKPSAPIVQNPAAGSQPNGNTPAEFDPDLHETRAGRPVFKSDGKTLRMKRGNPSMKIAGWMKRRRYDLIERLYPKRYAKLKAEGKIPAEANAVPFPRPGEAPNSPQTAQGESGGPIPFPTIESPYVAQASAPAGPSDLQIQQAAEATVDQTELAGITLAGQAGVMSKTDRAALIAAYVAYYRKNGIWQPPPWLGLVAANAVYIRGVVEKVDAEKPTTILGTFKARIRQYWLMRKMGKRKKPQNEEGRD